jgi:hypothetical protein
MADIYHDAVLTNKHPKFDATLFLVFALFLSVLGPIISKSYHEADGFVVEYEVETQYINIYRISLGNTMAV